MFGRTGALYQALQRDLQVHLDPSQFASSAAGETWWPDATAKQVAASQLVSKFMSKYTESGDVPEAASQAALDKFIACNQKCSEFVLESDDWMMDHFLGEMRKTLWEFFNPEGYGLLDLERIISSGGVGPGASVSARGDDLYTKIFDSEISYCGDHLLYPWEFTVSQDPRWFEALVRLYQRDIPRAVVGSNLSFVNKNTKTARSICTEPTINMWYQLGIGRIFADRLKSYFGIDLSRQPEINREMARLASQGADFCTIDLASASDSISIGLLEEILPPDVVAWLLKTRSPVTTLPDGSVVSLHMISTMGNGYTFPLQTIIFAAIVQSVYRVLNIPLKKRGMGASRTFAVFGDDIICTKGSYRQVVRLLTTLGFTVNGEKSFSQGLFYESCGADYFSGQLVRAFYIKRLKTTEDFYKAINGLNRWSALTGILLVETVGTLCSLVRDPLFVPLGESDDAGIHVPLAMARVKMLSHGIARYNARRPVKRYLLVKEDVIACGKDQRKRSYNPDGLWLSFLFGCVRGYRISCRQREVRYRTKRMISVSWDAISPLHARLGLDGPRLADAVTFNLMDVRLRA